jgi:hypothetical protein
MKSSWQTQIELLFQKKRPTASLMEDINDMIFRITIPVSACIECVVFNLFQVKFLKSGICAVCGLFDI